jgi:hypothetical protein
MPSSILEKSCTAAREANRIASYKESEGDYAQYAANQRVFRRTTHEYMFEGLEQEELDTIDRRFIRELFGRRRDTNILRGEASAVLSAAAPALSAPPLPELSTEAIKGVIRDEPSVVRRGQALEVLLSRGAADIDVLLARELEAPPQSRGWRNTLLLASEHVSPRDPGSRLNLRKALLETCVGMPNESHPRSRLALCGGLRTACALTDTVEALSDLTRFLTPGYPLEAVRVILISIRESPLSLALRGNQTALPDLRAAITAIARGTLTMTANQQAEAAFDLGLDALHALIAMNDAGTTDLVWQATALGFPWVNRELEQAVGAFRHPGGP